MPSDCSPCAAPHASSTVADGLGADAPVLATYHWNLATDALTWGPTLPVVIAFADEEAFGTGLGFAGFIAPESPSSRYEAIVASGGCDTGGGVAFQVVYGLTADARGGGPTTWIEDTGRWFADANGRPGLVQGTVRSVTERHEAERREMSAARCDPATGAYNPDFFSDHIERQLAFSSQKRTTFAVLLADVTVAIGGRRVDDGAARDEAVTAVVTRIRQEMRTNEVMGRQDRTRFAMLLENCNGEQMAAAAARLTAACSAEVETAAGPAAITICVGGVVAPTHGRGAEDLLGRAREALDIAAREATARFVAYEPELARREAQKALSQTADEIIAALNEGRVVLALQPIVDAETRRTMFFEALVRIRRDDGALLMPDVLVPAAEALDLVALLDGRVMDLAFAALAADPHLALSINASVISLHDPHWQEHCHAACRLDPNAASRLTVEVTESCAVADLDATRRVLLALREAGVKIAIDDFGSGHSSFRNLRGLPIDYLKIDGSFVRDLAHSPDDQFFIRTLIDLARNLQIPTVAEWIEDEATARVLTDWGVGMLQGHLFGRAEVPSQEFGQASGRGAEFLVERIVGQAAA